MNLLLRRSASEAAIQAYAAAATNSAADQLARVEIEAS